MIKLLFKLFKKDLMQLALPEYKPHILYKVHEKEFLKLAFNKQSKPINFDKLEQIFFDSNGLNYYIFPNELDLPVLRKGQLARLEQELYSVLSDDELGKFLEAMEQALERTDEQGNLKPNLGLIGKFISEMKGRKKLLLHGELMFEMVAASYIREDENPEEFDLEIQTQKVEQFKIDSKDGLYDFFYKSGISELVPFLGMSAEKWEEYLTLSQSEIKPQMEFVNSTLKNSKKDATLEVI